MESLQNQLEHRRTEHCFTRKWWRTLQQGTKIQWLKCKEKVCSACSTAVTRRTTLVVSHMGGGIVIRTKRTCPLYKYYSM